MSVGPSAPCAGPALALRVEAEAEASSNAGGAGSRTKRDFIVTKDVSDGAEVSLRRPTRRRSDVKEEVGLLRSVPQDHPGCTKRK
jgi:hypothetical protein